MFIVDVIPIARGVKKETLSYFSAKTIEGGQIVFVPIRRKNVAALVIDSRPLAQARTETRRAPFSLRKIDTGGKGVGLPAEILETARETALYHAEDLGTVLFSILPKGYIGKIERGEYMTPFKNAQADSPMLLIDSTEKRLNYYRQVIRGSFAKNQSILFVFPMIEELRNAYALLRNGIEPHCFMLYGDLKRGQIEKNWTASHTTRHPKAFFTTPAFSTLPFKVGTTVLEHESSPAWRMQYRPFIDFRKVVETLSRLRRNNLIIGDSIMRSDTLMRQKAGELNFITPPVRRIPKAPAIIEMGRRGKKGRFITIGKPLEEALAALLVNPGKGFILVSRRGLAPTTLCNDCGNTVLCKRCGKPVTLHEEKARGRIFLCHHCTTSRDAKETCAQCGSWNLVALGIGIELVEEKVRKRFPSLEIFRLDRDTTGGRAKITRLMSAFEKAASGLLVGTEMALPYLPNSLSFSAIVSLDAFLCIPDFTMNERILAVIYRLAEQSQGNIFVQTRHGSDFIRDLKSGSLRAFEERELAERKALGFPPFRTIIKITLKGREIAAEALAALKEALRLFEVYEVKDGNITLIAFLPPDSWPDEILGKRLREITPRAAIEINPSNLF